MNKKVARAAWILLAITVAAVIGLICSSLIETDRGEVMMIGRNLSGRLPACLVLAIGLWMVAFALLMLYLHAPLVKRAALLGGMLCFCGLWLLTGFSPSPYLTFNTLLDQLSYPMIVTFALLFCCTCLTERRKTLMQLLAIVWMLLFCIDIALRRFGSGQTEWGLKILHPVAILGAGLAILIWEHRANPTGRARLLLLEFAPCAAGVGVAFFWDLMDFFSWRIPLVCGVLVMTAAMTAELIADFLRVQKRLLDQQKTENELLRRQRAVTLNHLQPHFLYNALNAIQFLCDENPEQAAEAVGDFAGFLRGNMDSLQKSAPIPFERELQHLQCYVALEKLRFGERVQVEYTLQTTGFFLPALTLQPMVENSIRFGITKRAEGGTVRISTYETEQSYYLSVEDNGIGFDPRENLDSDRRHLDVLDIEQRLREQCGGQLQVTCRPGEGTVVTMILPKGESEHECDCGG